MTPAELVAAGRAAGCIFRLEQGRVRYRVPNTPHAAAIVAALGGRAAEVAAILSAENADDVAWLTGTAAGHAIARALGLDGRGGVVIRSRALGGQLVLFVRDVGVPIPEKYRHLVRFTAEELRQIGCERWSAEHLRTVVSAKAELRTAENPEQARLVPTEEAAAMRRTMIPAGNWCERDAGGVAPSRLGSSLDESGEKRQSWLTGFPRRPSEHP